MAMLTAPGGAPAIDRLDWLDDPWWYLPTSADANRVPTPSSKSLQNSTVSENWTPDWYRVRPLPNARQSRFESFSHVFALAIHTVAEAHERLNDSSQSLLTLQLVSVSLTTPPVLTPGAVTPPPVWTGSSEPDWVYLGSRIIDAERAAIANDGDADIADSWEPGWYRRQDGIADWESFPHAYHHAVVAVADAQAHLTRVSEELFALQALRNAMAVRRTEGGVV